MADRVSEESESDQDDEENLEDPKSPKKAYHELLWNLSILSKAYKNLWKDFKKLSKDHKELEKAFQYKVDVSLDASTKTCDAFEAIKMKESKLCLENETISKENFSPLGNF